jgi:hypothetical protein
MTTRRSQSWKDEYSRRRKRGMKQLLVALLLGFLLVGTASATTLVQDPSGAFRIYEDVEGSVASGMAMNSACPPHEAPLAVEIDLNAKASPIPDGVPTHFKTYYKAGDAVLLWATWRPFMFWDVPYVGRELTITRTLRKGPRVVFSDQLKSVLGESDAGWSGVAYWYLIPETVRAGEMFTFQVTFSVSGLDIADTHRWAPPSTRLFITDQDCSDLPVRFLPEFEQGHWEWGQDRLGTCRTTMARGGSATTSKAFLFDYFSDPATVATPGGLNECLTLNGGYEPGTGCLMPDDNTNDIALVCAPSDVLWEGYAGGPRLAERIRWILDGGSPVMVKALQYWELRYYVIVGRRGADQWNVFDPQDGQIHMMETRGLSNWMIRGVYLYSRR